MRARIYEFGPFAFDPAQQELRRAGVRPKLGNNVKVLDGISGAPAVCPDGHRLAFVRNTLITHGEDTIVTAAIDGSDERSLAIYKAPGIHFNRVTWTPDGKALVYPVQARRTTRPFTRL
jgi:Tol biopolymer transport system component